MDRIGQWLNSIKTSRSCLALDLRDEEMHEEGLLAPHVHNWLEGRSSSGAEGKGLWEHQEHLPQSRALQKVS
jgi:hypothetical protein